MQLHGISFAQDQLQNIAVAGESGAGKTTLLKIIAGLVQPDSGMVLFNKKKVAGPNDKLIPGHPHIAYLSQHYELLHNYRVEELIWFENKIPDKQAAQLFSLCQIDHLLTRKTSQLSGGERQRIALCMLLVKSPLMLVLDEPFSNLDLIHKSILKNVLEDVHERLKVTIIIASHEPADTLSWADEILVMKEGRIVQHGTPPEIYHQPKDEYVAGLFGRYNLVGKEQLALFHVDIPDKKSFIIRPESFIISSDNKQGIKAIVRKTFFFGSYFDTELSVGDFLITIRTDHELKTGEELYVVFNKHNIIGLG